MGLFEIGVYFQIIYCNGKYEDKRIDLEVPCFQTHLDTGEYLFYLFGCIFISSGIS